MEPLIDPVVLAWKISWEARGFKSLAKVCTWEEIIVAMEILEKNINKSLIMLMSWMPDSPPEKFLLSFPLWSSKASKVR